MLISMRMFASKYIDPIDIIIDVGDLNKNCKYRGKVPSHFLSNLPSSHWVKSSLLAFFLISRFIATLLNHMPCFPHKIS